MAARSLKDVNDRWMPWIVWGLRIAVGATFIISGCVKSIDPWGFIFKIEEYLRLWDMVQPRSLVLMGAVALSGAEFVLGILLLTGCYKRVVVWMMLAMMAGMIPLTLYIYLSNPVADCGCFGDFLVISNGATFLKNLLITAALVYLACFNRYVRGLFGAYIQWLVVFICSAYVMIIAFVGYNLQPLVDFRSFPVGRDLAVAADDAEAEEPEFEFVYEKDGRRETFAQDALPDSTWTFVDRHIVGGYKAGSDVTDFTVLDGGEDISSEIILSEGYQVLALIPEYDRADVSYTYLLNELQTAIGRIGGNMTALISGSQEDIEEWEDLSMAEYPIYTAEGTMLKEMARGTMALVGLHDGVIAWKRTAGSVDGEMVDVLVERNTPETDIEIFDRMEFDGPVAMRNLTLVLISILAVLFLLDRSGRLLQWKSKIHRLNKN
ncbi:MAG: DoxX family protein [Barnesiella sp.]|nr:DoxX family protein [Barnesiella sp.]